jgi:hypothetical protein
VPKKYVSTKVPSVKLCIDCQRILNRRGDRCVLCENKFKAKRTKRDELDEEYRLALLKHKM